MRIEKYLESNFLDYEIIEDSILFSIKGVGIFLVVYPKLIEGEKKLFDEKFNLILDETDMNLSDQIDFFAFQFGGKWYYMSKDEFTNFKPLKYLGKAKFYL